MRTLFQRDRDHIIHCKVFRRLRHKAQMLLSPEGDHYRTRLTHAPEASQIARTIACGLLSNKDLTEAILLEHDLGHTPSSYVDGRVLNELYEHGFRHNEQSVCVVKKLGNRGRGLNLTREVRDGILCHTDGTWTQTLEGCIVRLADKTAYINHNIDGAVRMGVLLERDIPEHITSILGTRRSARIGTLVKFVIRASDGAGIRMEEHISPLFLELRQFMFERVYFSPYAKREEEKVPSLIKTLFKYAKNPAHLPLDLRETAELKGTEWVAMDFIVGMTDRYAVMLSRDINIPRSWDH